MSAAVTRTRKQNHGSNERTQPGTTSAEGELKAAPVVQVARVTATDVGAPGEHGMTPLMRAASEGSAGTVQVLVDRGANLNAKRSDGFNALALAAFFGHSQVVWLLLENGADLAATGRSQTPPEIWAEVRGFMDIGNFLRETRATKLAEASSIYTAPIAEPARFPCFEEKEKVQPECSPEPVVELKVIDENSDSQISPDKLAVTTAEKAIAERSEPTIDTADIPDDDKAQHRTVVRQSLPAPKTLPEIQDPLPLVVPEFHPVSAFVARVTSSRKNLLALTLTLLLVAGGIGAFVAPQIRKSLGDGRTETPQKINNSHTESANPVAASGTNVSRTVEPPPAATTESTTSPVSKNVEVTAPSADSQGVESTTQLQSGEVAGEAAPDVNATTGSARSERGNRRQSSAATSMSQPGGHTRQQRATSVEVVKQEKVTEEQQKPAPLSVEASRSLLSTPAKSANDRSGDQPPPSSIISGKPKSKVIQWP